MQEWKSIILKAHGSPYRNVRQIFFKDILTILVSVLFESLWIVTNKGMRGNLRIYDSSGMEKFVAKMLHNTRIVQDENRILLQDM